MKNFLKMLFASCLGVFIAMFLIFIISMAMIAGMLSSIGGSGMYVLSDNTVLQIDLHGRINDREAQDFMPGLLGGAEKTAGLDDILRAIKTAKENDKIIGIYLKSGEIIAGHATLEPIRKALIDFKKSGKFIVAYGDYFTQRAYYISSVADRVIMNPVGMFMLHGMSATRQFNKGLFDKLGIEFEVFKVGDFKDAAEPFTETRMSDASREHLTAYVNCLWSHLLAGISESRGISVEQLNLYADEFMTFSAPGKSVMRGLVDTLMYVPDVKDYIKERAGGEVRFATVANINSVPARRARPARDKIAVLYAEGQIMPEEARRNLGLFAGNIITDEEYVRELRRLRDDESVRAVVFRINSPGGSAITSEQIWRAVVELREVKPVIVSMGDVAASGGYYIACAANMIVAEPTTITGSIGGFSLIPKGVELYRMLGISFDGVNTNKHSDFLSTGLVARPFTNEERQILQGYVDRFMEVFYSRVADGRSMTMEQVEAVAQGRVWTGVQALQNGLVDRLGSLDDAIKIAAELAEITDYEIVSYPTVRDPFTRLMEELMSGGVKASLIRTFLGDDVYRQYVLSKAKVTPVCFLQALLIEY